MPGLIVTTSMLPSLFQIISAEQKRVKALEEQPNYDSRVRCSSKAKLQFVSKWAKSVDFENGRPHMLFDDAITFVLRCLKHTSVTKVAIYNVKSSNSKFMLRRLTTRTRFHLGTISFAVCETIGIGLRLEDRNL